MTRHLLRWMPATLLALACTAAAQSVALPHQGALRSYLMHRPPQHAQGTALPLVIVLHGTSMRAADMLSYTDLPQLADRHGFLLAAPQALGNGFNDGLAPAGSEAAAVDDVGFVEALADDAQQRFGVRADAIYVVGFSNGGSMVQRLAIESRYPFAGFAAVASAVRVATPGVARPAPLLLVFGTADPLNPVDGGLVWIPAPHVKPAPAATVQQWAQRLRCDGAPALAEPAPGVRHRVWQRCAEAARLAWISIDGLGHHWAGARPMPFPRFVLGPQLAEPKLGELVWQFLVLSATRTSSAAPAPTSTAAPPAAPPVPTPVPPPAPAIAR
jgi:polyhydroxybutyrate depolymerase